MFAMASGGDCGEDATSDLFGIILMVNRESDQGDACGMQGLEEEAVSLLAILCIVRGVVEFNGGHDSRCFRCHEHEVEMLLGDLATIGAFPICSSNHIR